MQIELVEESRHVVGVGIHLIAAPGLTRAPMPSPIVRDDAIAAHPEEEHLRVPGVGRERPPVRKDDRLSGSPILIKDVGAVFGGKRAHGRASVRNRRRLSGCFAGNTEQQSGRKCAPLSVGFPIRSACLAVTIEFCRRRAPWSGWVTGPATPARWVRDRSLFPSLVRFDRRRRLPTAVPPAD